ncbi:hypothetical protein, partial [Salmonella enterica]|uniref:hypothetical protein n=1 Tax=Salmonella enterica TaxID=28901 RepID=UPI0020C2B3DD
MLMAQMQALHISDTGPVYDTDGLSQVPEQTIITTDLISQPTSESDKAQNVQHEPPTSHYDDSQLDPVVTFDDQDDLMVNIDTQIDSVV